LAARFATRENSKRSYDDSRKRWGGTPASKRSDAEGRARGFGCTRCGLHAAAGVDYQPFDHGLSYPRQLLLRTRPSQLGHPKNVAEVVRGPKLAGAVFHRIFPFHPELSSIFFGGARDGPNYARFGGVNTWKPDLNWEAGCHSLLVGAGAGYSLCQGPSALSRGELFADTRSRET